MAWTNPKTWAAAVLTVADMNTHVRDNLNFLKANIALEAAVELTIATGVVTKTKAFHKIDTEANAASDDLDTINGGSEGDILLLRADNAVRTIVLKDGADNLDLDGADITLDGITKWVMLGYDGTSWRLLLPRKAIVYGVVGHCHVGRVNAA